MWKIFSLLSGIGFSKRMNAEKENQEREGYRVKIVRQGINSYLEYCDGPKMVRAEYQVDKWWTANWILYFNSYLEWSEPKRTPLTKEEHDLVTQRFVRFLEVWGGEVTLDYADYVDADEYKKWLDAQGIEYSENDGVLIYQAGVETLREHMKKK